MLMLRRQIQVRLRVMYKKNRAEIGRFENGNRRPDAHDAETNQCPTGGEQNVENNNRGRLRGDAHIRPFGDVRAAQLHEQDLRQPEIA